MSDNIDDLFGVDSKDPKDIAQKPVNLQATTNQNVPQSTDDDEITYSPARTNNYKASRALATTFKTLSWVSGGIGGLSGLSALGSLGSNDGFGYNFGLAFGIMFLMVGLIFAFIFSFLSESINVMLDIEANSRQAAKTLENLLRAQ